MKKKSCSKNYIKINHCEECLNNDKDSERIRQLLVNILSLSWYLSIKKYTFSSCFTGTYSHRTVMCRQEELSMPSIYVSEKERRQSSGRNETIPIGQHF